MASVEQYSDPFPWRTATLVASVVAFVELVGLIAVGALLIAHPFRHHKAGAATVTTAAPAIVRHPTAPVRQTLPVPAKDRVAATPSHPLRPRANVRVLVLNANGVAGAAHAEAARLGALGYSIGGAANAPSHHYAQSMVMYVPGYAKEARRLGHEAGIRMVAPVDGLQHSALMASKLVVLLGS
ncbi:MAG: LytR C-terminal domain-containing protein [Gaiellaceae bacterium]